LHAQQSTKPPQASGGGANAAEPSFRLIRAVSGTKLIEQGGPSGVQDPRSVFYAPADKEIIVYFTWEGPPGQHHFEGLWKNPSGKIAMTSEFDFKPQQPRFGGYFKMILGDAPATGSWTLEARINGETAGSHSFQVSNDPRPDGVAAMPLRRMLIPSELYNRAAAASVVIENINTKGARRNIGSGFFIGPDRVLTAFQVVDNANKVRVIGPKGNTVEASEVLAVNRRQDWIVLKVPLENAPTLARATDSWAIGDRVYLLDVPAENNRVLVETSLIGKQSLNAADDRINIADTVNRRAVGSPLLNEYGEVIGFIGGSLLPGSAFIEDLAFSARTNSLGVASRGTLAVPIQLVDDASGTATTIEGLAKSGQFIPALVSSQSVLSGVLARTVNKKIDPPRTIEERTEISRASPECVVFITWLPTEKRKGYPSLRIYDLDNRLLTEYLNKKKITVTPNKLSYSLWDLKLAGLPNGIYRIDALLDGDFVWRTFFRMVD
jgi:S1-C subfamily serine protease